MDERQDNVTYQQRLAIIQIVAAGGILIAVVLFSVGLTFAATGGDATHSSFNSNGTQIENQGLYDFGNSLLQNAWNWWIAGSVTFGITIGFSTWFIMWTTTKMRLSIDPNYIRNKKTSNNLVTTNKQSDSNVHTNQTHPESKVILSDVAPAYAQISSTGYTGNKYFATRPRLSYHPANKQFMGTLKDESGVVTEVQPKKLRGILPKGWNQN